MLAKKSFGGNKRNFLKLLMRFVRRVRDHIPSQKNDHRPSYRQPKKWIVGRLNPINSQPSGLALPTKASMFQPLLPFDCWANVLSGRPRNRLVGQLSPACPTSRSTVVLCDSHIAVLG